MSRSLFIIRNPDSPLLKYINFEKENYMVVLIQNAVYSDELRKKKVKILKEDAELSKINAGNQVIDYNELLNLIFSNDKVVCI